MERETQPNKSIQEDIAETTERVSHYPSYLRTISSVARVERDRRLAAQTEALPEGKISDPLQLYRNDTGSGEHTYIGRI